MANWKKIGIISGIGAGVVGLVTYVSRLNRAQTQLESVTTAKIHSLKLDGLTIRVDVQLKNPSRSSFNIKFPFVKLVYKDKVVGTSQVIDKNIKIPAYGEANIESIMIKIPVTSIFSIGAGLVKLLLQKVAVVISVKTISTIDLGWKKLPYEKSDDMTLHPKA
ncbi:MAG: hypothetical protein IM600_03695 [Bacteroidetes bacterium]|nr:hypothetical protein [Bacteroidota bacterium]MCA6442512.1 hypothetical protein [Bacteroidota bacterium]